MLIAPPKRPAAPRWARTRKRLVVGALAALLLLTIGVVWLLPQWIAGRPTRAPEPAAATGVVPEAPGASLDAVQRAQDKRNAEAMLERVLRRRAQLMEASVERWAADDYAAALKHLAEGDVAFESARYREALEAYTAADGQLAELAASRPRRLADALRAAAAAFARGQADAAARQYRIVLAIDPGNAEAAHGLRRAQRLDEVLGKVKQGRAQAKAGHWEAARDAFAAAVALDPEYAPASTALKEATATLIDLRFARRLSAFYQALSANRLDTAAERLDQARKLKPQAGEVTEARQRLRSAARQAALEGLRAKAARQVKAEQWDEALKSYALALKVDPNVAFAQRGLIRGKRRAQMDASFERYLEDATRLYSPEPLARARELLVAAEAVDDGAGPRLTSQRKRLKTLIDQAGTPLTVAIVSDGLTEVTLYRVSALGRFVNRRLDLLPGDYVAVGSRKGYRDVRRSFSLRPGVEPEDVIVICEERL